MKTLWKEQQNDLDIQKIMKGSSDVCNTSEGKFVVIEDVLYRKIQLSDNKSHYRLWIPKTLKTSILQACHDSPFCGHQGMFKTYKRLQDVVFWPKIWDEVKSYV